MVAPGSDDVVICSGTAVTLKQPSVLVSEADGVIRVARVGALDAPIAGRVGRQWGRRGGGAVAGSGGHPDGAPERIRRRRAGLGLGSGPHSVKLTLPVGGPLVALPVTGGRHRVRRIFGDASSWPGPAVMPGV